MLLVNELPLKKFVVCVFLLFCLFVCSHSFSLSTVCDIAASVSMIHGIPEDLRKVVTEAVKGRPREREEEGEEGEGEKQEAEEVGESGGGERGGGREGDREEEEEEEQMHEQGREGKNDKIKGEPKTNAARTKGYKEYFVPNDHLTLSPYPPPPPPSGDFEFNSNHKGGC